MQMWFGRDGPFSHRKNWRAGHYGPVTPTMAVLIRRQGPGPGTRKGSGRAHGITGDPGSCRLVGGGSWMINARGYGCTVCGFGWSLFLVLFIFSVCCQWRCRNLNTYLLWTCKLVHKKNSGPGKSRHVQSPLWYVYSCKWRAATFIKAKSFCRLWRAMLRRLQYQSKCILNHIWNRLLSVPLAYPQLSRKIVVSPKKRVTRSIKMQPASHAMIPLTLSQIGTLPLTEPLLPPCGTTTKFLALKHWRISCPNLMRTAKYWLFTSHNNRINREGIVFYKLRE